MNANNEIRNAHEKVHGKLLASLNTETIWGWGTPAGKLRARRRAELIFTSAKLNPGALVLELGCGTGLFTAMFARTGAKIIAVDISPELIEKAKARGLSKDRVQFLCQSFEKSKFKGPFDAVIGSSVLHHLDVQPALSRIYELLKPGGVMAFAEPNMLNPQVFSERTFLRRRLIYVSPDETAFVRWRLYTMLLQVGFEGINITPFDWLHPATPVSMIKNISRIGSVLEKIPFIREFAGSLHIRCHRPI